MEFAFKLKLFSVLLIRAVYLTVLRGKRFVGRTVFLLEGHKAPFPVGTCMLSCMNRIWGSKWVDDTITLSDLHAPAPRLWCALQICPHLEKNISEQNIIFIIFDTQSFSSRQNKIFQPFLGDTVVQHFHDHVHTFLVRVRRVTRLRKNISAELEKWFFLIYSLSVRALTVLILTTAEVMLSKILLSLQWVEKGK